MTYFSRQTDYAIQLVAALSKLSDSDLLSLKIFSIESNISFLFLQKIARNLKKYGIIKSVRGAHGGYSLAKPASQITIRHILEAIEGTISAADCQTSGQKNCQKMDKCSIHCVMDKINGKMLGFLDETTLADFK